MSAPPRWHRRVAPTSVLRVAAVLLAMAPAAGAFGADPAPREGDFVSRDFHFASGASLPELRIHYRTFGQVRSNAHGVVRNAVLILHGTTGNGSNFLGPEFAGELFGPGQPL